LAVSKITVMWFNINNNRWEKAIMRLRPLTLLISLILLGLSPKALAADQTYTWEKPPSHVVFNKITNNPKAGDERLFLSVRDIKSSAGQRSLTVQPGQELALTVYFDNNANKSSLVASSSKVKITFPGNYDKSFSATSTVSANNADPSSSSDAVTITSSQPVRLVYEAGSAKIWNNVWRGQSLSDTIINNGTAIGYDKLDGNVPGGPSYSGYVTIKVLVAAQTAASGVPNTGPGDVIGIFAGASAAGTAIHLTITGRRRTR
jgi:hypothetical protein